MVGAVDAPDSPMEAVPAAVLRIGRRIELQLMARPADAESAVRDSIGVPAHRRTEVVAAGQVRLRRVEAEHEIGPLAAGIAHPQRLQRRPQRQDRGLGAPRVPQPAFLDRLAAGAAPHDTPGDSGSALLAPSPAGALRGSQGRQPRRSTSPELTCRTRTTKSPAGNACTVYPASAVSLRSCNVSLPAVTREGLKFRRSTST